MPANAIRFSMFSSFTFSCLSCTLASAKNAIEPTMEGDADSLEAGRFTMDEIFLMNEDGRVSRRSAASSCTALLFETADKNKTIAVSNVTDGWVTLCNAIAFHAKTDLYTFSFSEEEDPDARNALEYRDYSSPQMKERVVHAMKDPRWAFYEKGEPLYFEDVANYKKRKIKDKVNKQILVSYCNRLGLNVEDPDFLNPRGSVLRIQHSW